MDAMSFLPESSLHQWSGPAFVRVSAPQFFRSKWGQKGFRSGPRELVHEVDKLDVGHVITHQAPHHSGHAMPTDLQATRLIGRVLTTNLPAGLREQGIELTGVGLHVLVGDREGGDGVVLVHGRSWDGRWC